MTDQAPEEPGPASDPISWMAKNRVAANVLMLVLIVGGVVTLATGIKQEVFPEVELDQIRIDIVYPGASPAEVEQGVVLAVEEEVRGIDGVKKVVSSAAEGIAIVRIELLLGTDQDRALNDVKSAVDRITSFPQDVERPTISLMSNRQQVISIVLYGDVDEATLRKLAEDTRQELLQDDRITYTEISGTRPLEISIEVPQAELRKHNLTLPQIADRVRAASVEVPGGGVKTQSGEVLLRTAERRDRGTEYGDIVLLSQPDGSQVRVRDLAEVKDAFREIDREVTFNDKPAVMIHVFRVGEETPLTVAAAAKEYVEKLESNLPPGLYVSTWADLSEMYEQRMQLLMKNARIGLVLVLLTLGLFLEARLGFWVTLGIPISFAGSLLFFPAADVSINMISLFAFIVTLGMVVDDAIVVGEAIYKRRTDGQDFLSASIDGAKEVAQPVIFAILTTCIAFMPMLFVPGVMGKFFRVIPIVVIAVLMISLVESLLILPAHLSHPMSWWLRVVLSPYLWVMSWLERLRMADRLQYFIDHIYRRQLEIAMKWRYLTVALALAIVVVSVGLVAGGRIPFTFLPKIEGDVITAMLRMPVGTPFEQTRKITDNIAGVAKAIIADEDATGETTISRGMFVDLGAASSIEVQIDGPVGKEGSHLSTVMMYLVENGKRKIPTGDFVKQWREGVGEIPGAESFTFHYEVGVQPGEPVNIQLIHKDVDTLEAAAERLADEITTYSGLQDIDSGVSVGKEQLDFTLTAAAKAQGLTEAELARQVRGAFYGVEAVRQQRGRDELRVYVRRPLAERRSLHHVEELIVQTPTGGEMPLAQAADIERGRAYTVINRTDGRRTVSVTADITDQDANANEIVAQILDEGREPGPFAQLKARLFGKETESGKGELVRLIEEVPGLDYSLGGEQERQAETNKSLFSGYILALIVMFSMLAVVFRSYGQPLLVLSAIPFGMVGAIWGHLVMGFSLSIMSMMGLVALSGVVVNDSLILIVSINRFRDSGMGTWDAIIAGGMRRFRPILLTSLTTFFGLAPMIVETSVQARFLIPMAISLGYGVLAATFIMLLLVPCFYLMLEDFQTWSGNEFARLRGKPPLPAMHTHSTMPPPPDSILPTPSATPIVESRSEPPPPPTDRPMPAAEE